MHSSKYIQSSSPIIHPISIILHLVFPHFSHLNFCPEKSVFSAMPSPVFSCSIFSVIIVSFELHGSQVSQVLQTK